MFARSTIPEEKWRLLVVYPRAGLSVSLSDLLAYYSLLVARQPRSQGPLLLIPRSEWTLGTRVGIALDYRAERHGFDSGRINIYPPWFYSRGWTNTRVLNNREMKVLPLPCKWLDLRVARMTTKNGGFVS